MKLSLSDFAAKLRTAAATENAQFCIVYHINPDGDCIGSAYALMLILRTLGAKCAVCGRDPVPANFRNMTDDEKAQFILDALKDKPPSFLPDNDTQRFMWHLGGDDKPTIVPDSQLDGMRGQDLYRQVAGIHDSTLGNDLNSSDIANQIMTGDFTMYANGGGTALGRAIYFGNDYGEIRRWYGTSNSNRVRGGGNDSTMIRVKMNPQAKSMDYYNMTSAMQREVQSGSKLGKALSRIRDTDDRAVVYAISKGIDYSYHKSSGYYMVYNRGCLLASARTKHNANDSSW